MGKASALPARDGKKVRICFLIALFAFFLYGNTIRNGYALDDNFVTSTSESNPNPRVQKGIAGIPDIFSSHYFESAQQSFEYRPVVLATFAIEYQFFKRNPYVSHFVNVLVYALTGILLFSCLVKIFKAAVIVPLLITLIFLAHPIHTEVVSNLKSRDELLSFFFGLCSLYFFLKNNEKADINTMALSLLFLFLGLLSKRTAFLFVPFIPFTAYFFLQVKLKRTLILVGLYGCVYLVFVLMMKLIFHGSVAVRNYAFFENPLFYETNLLKRLALVFYSIGYYVQLLIVPYPLSCYYGYKIIPAADWSFLFCWLSLIFYFFIGIYALKNFSKRDPLSYAIWIYLLGIFPFSNLLNPIVGVVGERFVYFSSLGFCMALAFLLFRLFKTETLQASAGWKSFRPASKAVLIVILFLYSVKVISRNRAWKDELTLFRTDVKNSGNSCNLDYLCGNALAKKIQQTANPSERNTLITEAKECYKKAAELMEEGKDAYPKDYITLNNLGMIYTDIFNEPARAQPLFRKALQVNPTNTEAQYNYAFCYGKRNMPDSAIIYYRRMIDAGTKYLPAYFRLHDLYHQAKRYPEAIQLDKKALEIDPRRAEVYINLGNSYMLGGDTLNGLKYFEEASVRAPNNLELYHKVEEIRKLTGKSPARKQIN